jgi:hypothetical protein
MARTVHCHVLGGDVTVSTNSEGKTVNVVCPQFSRIFGNCQLKADKQGLISGTLAVASDRLTGSRLRYCEFVDQESLE